jgi:hypothetical protein
MAKIFGRVSCVSTLEFVCEFAAKRSLTRMIGAHRNRAFRRDLELVSARMTGFGLLRGFLLGTALFDIVIWGRETQAAAFCGSSSNVRSQDADGLCFLKL